MTFYQELQLSSVGSKQLIKNTTDKKEKRRHILIYNFKVYLVMAFCVAVVTLFNRRTENYQYDASGSGIFCECGMYSDSHDFRMPQCDHVKPVHVCPWISAFAGV